MVAIILILAASLCGSMIFKKKIHETLPIAVFTVTLAVYVFALILPLPVAIWISAGIITALFTGVCIYLRSKGRELFWGISREDMSLRGILASPLLVLVAVSAIFCFLMSERHVFFYDDLSYWGLYTKNIFAINKLPHLFENCSVDYKDYTPIMQILQYIAMYGSKTFSEAAMYQTNVCFIYVMLLPILSAFDRNGSSVVETDGKRWQCIAIRILAIVMYVIFPHILTAQFYYRLGVDLFLALVFGYILYYIFADEENELFRMTAIVTAISFLALIKTSGIVLCIFAIIIYFVGLITEYKRDKCIEESSDKKKKTVLDLAVSTAVVAIFAFGSYMTWQLFLRYSWNNGYLSNRVKDGITGGGFSFPEYTGEVVGNYIHHFFFYPLTRNTIGVTAFVLLIFVVVAGVICFVGAGGRRDATKRVPQTRSGEDCLSDWRPVGQAPLLITTIICFVIFCIAHISMYLFVFDEWEAHGLLEFDRYITQYLGGLFYVAVIILIGKVCDAKKRKAPFVVLSVSTIVFIALLPYSDMRDYLIPANYREGFEKAYGQKVQDVQEEWESSGIADLNLPHDGSARVTVIADVWDDASQFLEYTAVPQPIDDFINVPAIEAGNLAGFIESHHEQYVYVARNAEQSYTGDWAETGRLTDDGTPLEGGMLYVEARENDTKTLVKAR